MSKLIYVFKNQSQDYGLGFQAGQIWELLKSCEGFEYLFVREIVDEVEDMLKHQGITNCDIEYISTEWCKLIVRKTI